MASPFVIEEHTFEGQHIREHPRALASSQEDTIQLHAKSYTPHGVANGSAKGDLTIILYHANAFHKEVYEPFFEALYACLRRAHGITIGSIWIADQAAQGTSGLLNDHIHGNDPSWFDHARDVLTMSNVFRKRMKRPIVAVGHSMGGTQAVATSHLHPRLFEAIVAIDAVISLSRSPSSMQMLKYAFSQPEAYETREQAEKAVRKSPIFKGWDPRVVQRYVDTAFHSDPIATNSSDKVKPTTTKHAEASTLVRSQIAHPTTGENDVTGPQDTPAHASERKAELAPDECNTHPKLAWSWLPTLRPSILFIHGEGSRVCRPEEMETRTKITGTAPGGNGGVEAGNVKLVTVAGGHLAPMTNVQGTAETVGQWLSDEIARYRRREGELVKGWGEQDLAQKQKVEPAVQKSWKRWEGKEFDDGKDVKTKSRL